MIRLIASFAVVTAASLLPLAAPSQEIPDRHASGYIWSVDRHAITMQNRRVVFLRHGTQIEPRGLRLEPGQHIVVQGEDAGNGNIDASAIRVLGKQYVSRGYGSWYGGRDDQVASTPQTLKADRRRPSSREQARR